MDQIEMFSEGQQRRIAEFFVIELRRQHLAFHQRRSDDGSAGSSAREREPGT